MSPLSIGPEQVRHLIETLSRPRATFDPDKLARRRAQVAFAKRLLPILATLLLASVALWPEVSRMTDRAKRTFEKLGAVSSQASHILGPRYRGVDARNQPYNVTALEAGEPVSGRYDLVLPKADMFMQPDAATPGVRDASWSMVWSKQGVYMTHLSELDLSGNVTVYRGNGMMFFTDAAALDLRGNNVVSSNQIHAEGPLGTMDGQAFAILDHGNLLQLAGPAKLVLNAAQHSAPTSRSGQ